MQNITDMSGSVLAEKVKAGELSAIEATKAHIHRIEEVNPKINAVVIPLFEQARSTAKVR